MTEPNGLAVAGFVIGIVSLVMPLILGVVVALIGRGLSIPGAVQAGRTGAGKTLAIWGIVLSSIGLIFIL